MKIAPEFNKKNRFWFAVLATCALIGSGCGGSSTTSPIGNGKFTRTDLVSNVPGRASVTDPNLVNAWGVSFAPGGPFWLSDNGTGLSTLYDGTGAIQTLVVKIPAAGGAPIAPVTGQVYNGTNGFVIPGLGPALFIFDNEDGVISAWNASQTNAVLVNDRSGSGAVYKGLAIAANGAATFLYATNFNSGMVDVFDSTFTLVNSFTDPTMPAGFAPFGIQAIGGLVYVTYAKQDAAKHDEVAGAGLGYVDVFMPSGTLKTRLVSTGALNSPWGLAQAPAGYGNVGNALLVGNFGDGTINAYNITTGASLGPLKDSAGTSIAIDGLWAIIFGNGGLAGNTNTLYFTAGPNGESNGLFGSLTGSP